MSTKEQQEHANALASLSIAHTAMRNALSDLEDGDVDGAMETLRQIVGDQGAEANAKPEDQGRRPILTRAPGEKMMAGKSIVAAMLTDDLIAIANRLEQAKQAMTNAAESIMRTDPPRDTDRAWKSVAMQYPEDFVQQHYNELQDAFNEGLRNKIEG